MTDINFHELSFGIIIGVGVSACVVFFYITEILGCGCA
jgi:hypothetical protein